MQELINGQDRAASATPPPTYAQCRAAARSIARAEFGSEAIDSMRPRGVLLFRSRGPLPLVLYVAARDGRLVWRGPDSLGLLQPPADRPRPVPGGRPRLALLRLVERRWELLLFALPPAVLLLTALGLVISYQLHPVRAVLYPTLALAVFALVYIAVLMAVMCVNGIGQMIREFAGRKPAGDVVAAQTLPGRYWSMVLCHHTAPTEPAELLRHTARHLSRLITADVRRAAVELGGRARAVDVTETLVCLRRGGTTARVREAVLAWTVQPQGFGSGPAVTVRISHHRAKDRPARMFDAGSFLVWYSASVIIMIALEAVLVADWERAACAGGSCAGRPATYVTALRWLAQRLLLTDPPELSPATMPAGIVGWLTSLMSLTGIGVLWAAIHQYRNYRAMRMAEYEKGMNAVNEQTRVLVLVATAVEREAVLAAVHAANRAQPERGFLANHTVLQLGPVSNAKLMLAETTQGAVGPTAAAITAAALIDRLEPDYLILTGICYGLHEDWQQLCDIIVCSQLRAIDHRKVAAPDVAGDPDRVLVRGDQVTPSPTLLDRFRTADLDWRNAPVHFGPMLSASVLVDAKAYRDDLLRLHPDAFGGEMEGAEVYAAAAAGRVDWIVMKAISDWGYDKSYDHQAAAARNAADFLVHMLRTGALDERVGAA